MNHDPIMERLRDVGALREGHFSEADGSCSRVCVSLPRLFQRPQETAWIAGQMARRFSENPPQMVVGAGEGSMVLAYELARQLGAQGLYALRHNGTMTIRREMDVVEGGSALLAADEVVTGQKIRETVELMRALNVRILGIVSVLDLSEGKAHFRFPYYPLAQVEAGCRPRRLCPLCKQGVPFDRAQ